MDMRNHGVIINGVYPTAAKCGITIDGDFLPFSWDDESVYFNISKPTTDELTLYKVYELNSKAPDDTRKVRACDASFPHIQCKNHTIIESHASLN